MELTKALQPRYRVQVKRMLRLMRFTAIILLATCLQLSARSRGQVVTLSVKNVHVKEVFKAISHQTGLNIFIDASLLATVGKVTLDVKNMPVEKVMEVCLRNKDLEFTVDDAGILVKKKVDAVPMKAVASSTSNSPPPVIVTGSVKDKNTGQGLEGVTVRVKGGSGGVTTGANGAFTLRAKEDNPVLIFSFVGYRSQEVVVGLNNTVNISLELDQTNLDDVVVVGYGTQRKINLTGAVATVGSERLESRPIVNLGDGLNGLIPNLNVNINNGQPGTGSTFNIRGYTTIGQNSSSSPLVLVDGVQRDPNLIDPNDVASVTVLKDASSASIYGSRSAYGVILITTKTGKKGALQVNYSGSYTVARPTKLPDYINSEEYINLFNSAQRTGLRSGGYTAVEPFSTQDSIAIIAHFRDPANNPDVYVDPGNAKRYRYVGNTDWIKVLYPGWAPQQQHYLSLSGGEGKTTFTSGFGYFTQDGLEKLANQVYKRYSPNLKINSDVTKWLTLNLNMSLTHTDNNQSAYTRESSQGGAWIPTDLRPVMPVYHPDGNFSGQGNFTNPLAVIQNNGRDIDAQNDFWATGRIILRPIEHITVTADYTWNSFTSFRRAQLIPYREYGVDGVFLNIFPHTNPSRLTENRRNNSYKAINAYATYENTFKAIHSFKALVGYNQEYQHYQLSNSVASNLIDPTLPAIGVNNDSKPVVGGTETESALVGTFFRLNYNFDRRYLLEVNGRYDGTSRFPEQDRYAFSPSASIGWNIAEEAFMQGIKSSISELKIRASYGQLPNQQIPFGTISSAAQYPYIATQLVGAGATAVPYIFNNQTGITVAAPGLISTNLTWEKVQTKNIGLDFSLLKNRLSGSFDYFITKTKDMLVFGQQLPAVLGIGAPLRNAAELQTKGWEFSLIWSDRLLNNQLYYNLSAGLSDTKSSITKYDLNKNLSLNDNDYYPGKPLGEIWGYQTEGFYATDAEAAAMDNSDVAGYKWLAGDIKYADLNQDKKINDGNYTLSDHGDLKVIGNRTPRYRFNFNLNFSYKNFDFTSFIQGVVKADFAPNDMAFYAFHDVEWNLPYKYATDHWTPENQNAYFPRPRFKGYIKPQTKYIQNAGFARVKQLTLGYSLPVQLISKLHIQKLRVYATGANLFTKTSLFKAYDPELVTNNSGFFAYPINKSVSFGLQLQL